MMSVEHRLMVVQSLLKETEQDAALIAAKLVMDLARIPKIRMQLTEELERQAGIYSGPRGKILQGIAQRLREAEDQGFAPNPPIAESYSGD